MGSGRSRNDARKRRYHRLYAQRSYSIRRQRAIEFERVQEEIGRRLAPKLASDPLSSAIQLEQKALQDIVSHYGAPMVTGLLRDTLGIAYLVNRKSRRRGDSFDGWLIITICKTPLCGLRV